MPKYKRLPLTTLSRKVLSAAIASSLLLLSNAHATGLGRLTVLSALGQPLRAEIELTSANKDEVGSLVPKLASIEAFKQASIDFNPALLSMRFSVESRGAGYVIRVTSTQAMNEPFVDLLLEMNSSSGKLLREYTFLLDPAELRNSQSAQVANPVNISTSPLVSKAKPAQQPANDETGQTTLPATQKKAIEKKPLASREAPAAGEYQIKAGDTLSRVAEEFKSDGVSLDQMLVGLYKANPQAFSGNNMNRLRVGQILTIPDSESSKTVSVRESHSVVMAHAADFNSYRNKLAGQVLEAPAQKTTTSKQEVGGTITSKVKEVPTATNEALDKLKLSKATQDVASKSAISKAAEEERIAKDRAIADANARVKELEKNVGELNKLLKIKDKDLAEKQAAAAPKIEAKTESKAAVTKPLEEVSKTVASPVAMAPAKPEAAADATQLAGASAPVTPPPVAAPKKKRVAPPPPPEPSFFESVMNSGFVLPIGVIAALVAAVGIVTSRRKKKQQQFDDSILTGSSMKANSMFGSTGGQSVDTNNSVFNSNFAPSASQLDANEVDPIAEADVYIAYGRDSQAEEILKEALRTQPDRHAVRVKLLEIYANRKDPRSFERLASELYGMTSGEGDEWSQAASMGVMLEPTNPLYAGGKAQSDAIAGAALGGSTQPIEDLDPEALLGHGLSEDMLESISIIDTASGLTEGDASLDAPTAPKDDEPASFDIGSLDFDLDIPANDDAPQFDAPLLPENAPKTAAAAVDAYHESPVVDFGTIDFDLGAQVAETASNEEALDVSALSLSNEEPQSTGVDNDVNHIDFESSSLPSNMSSDMPFEETAEEGLADAPVAEKNELNVSSPDFEFDLSGIDLNLDSAAVQQDSSVSEVADVEMDDQVYNAEMATKLDLAVAYHEIGDKEGARELLDEVLVGGTHEQVEKAKGMLAQLS